LAGNRPVWPGRRWDENGATAAAAVITAATPAVPGTFRLHRDALGKHRASEQRRVQRRHINERYGVADREGSFTAGSCTADDGVCTGSTRIAVRTDADPRVNFTRTGGGTDVGSTAGRRSSTSGGYFDLQGFVPVASGLEARLIRAETCSRRNEQRIHHAARQSPRESSVLCARHNAAIRPWGHSRSSRRRVAGSTNSSKRAYWLWLSGHRLGDMRRLMRSYGRTEAQVFPTAAYFKQNLQYDGTDVNFPVPIDEENNRQFPQCTDRLP